MSDITLNDDTVISGELWNPLVGNWTAECYVDTDQVISGQKTLTWTDTAFKGTIIRSGEEQGQIKFLMVGGMGNLSKTVPGTMYDHPIPLRLIVGDILNAVGETLSTNSVQSFLNQNINRWIQYESSAEQALSQLVGNFGGVWRVLPDGTIYIGVDNFPEAADFDYEITVQDPSGAYDELSLESVGVLPGQALNGKPIGYVVYKATSGMGTLACVYYQDLTNPMSHPLRAGLEAIIKEVTRDTQYLRVESGTVRSQNSDGSLEITVDSTTKISRLSKIPYRSIPSGVLTLQNGDRVQIMFEGSNPQMCYATLFEMGKPASAKAIVRMGDKIDIGSLKVTAISSVAISGTYTDGYDGTVTPWSLNTPLPLVGKAVAGSARIKIE